MARRKKKRYDFPHLPDYDPWRDCGDEYDYYPDDADKAIAFFENELRFTKGKWKGQPFILSPFQKDIIRCLFGFKRKSDGVRRYRKFFLYIPRKNGKALAIDTPIPTPGGFVNMSDLKVGDYVFNEYGHAVEIINATDVMYDHKCYEIEFTDGSKIVSDADHQWKTFTRSPWEKYGVYTTEYISKTIMRGKDRNHRLDIPDAILSPVKDLPIEPYVLGAWLGDGGSYDARFCCSHNDLEIVDYIKEHEPVELWESRNGCNHYFIGKKSKNGSLQKRLNELGLLKKDDGKHIPEDYLFSTVNDRLNLLRGLLDTDGTISKAGRVEFTSVSKTLAEDVLTLIRSLGYKATIKGKITSCGSYRGYAYRVSFTPLTHIKVFKLKRKKQRQRISVYKSRSNTKHFKSVKEVSSVPVRCIEVDSPSHIFLAGKSFTPTHNSEFVAGIANYIMFCDQENDAEIYVGARDRGQALTLYNMIKGMIEQNERLNSEVEFRSTNKEILATWDHTKTQAISSDALSAHSLSPHVGIVDEVHAQPNGDLITAITSGMGAREQPLTILITTADLDRPSICNEELDFAKGVRDGRINNPRYLPVIYETPKDADYTLEETWKIANPNYPVTPSKDFMEEQVMNCQGSNRKISDFKRYNLNMKTSNVEGWLDMDSWDKGECEYTTASLLKERCWGAIDLSSKTDLSAFALLFESGKTLLKAYTCELAVEKDVTGYYRDWVDAGLLTVAGVDRIDYDYIKHDMEIAQKKYDVLQWGYDPWNATQFVLRLEKEGFDNMVEFRQGLVSMNEPAKEFEALVIEGKILHNNPVLNWMASNVTIKEDESGNIKPCKMSKDSPMKVDGIICLVMCTGLRMVYEEEEGSAYDEHEIRYI